MKKILKLSNFKIFIIFLLFTTLGAFVFPKLSVKLNPSSTLPSITINYSWANSSPYTLEQDITSKLESGFSTLRGLEKLSSKSSKGQGYITLEFDKYTNIDIARFETATVIRQLYKKLPEQSSYPIISVNKPNESQTRAFISYSIKANTSSLDIQEMVSTQIQPFINSIKNVDRTQIYGANNKEYIISLNDALIRELKIKKNDLINALQTFYKKASLGSVFFKDQYISLSLLPTTEKIGWHIPVKKIDGRLIYLDEFATIKEQEQETQNYYRINGDNSITLNVYATKKANTITLSEKIQNTINSLEKTLPKDYSIIKTYDSTEYLSEELKKIYKRSSYTVIILLLFILLVSRSVKYLLVTLISLTANISIAFLFYYIFNIEIQLYSLAGIAISLGLIIDNSIVMIDHLRYRKNKDIFIPILASTLTTIGSLAVIFFLDDKLKVNLIDFALVIIINLGVSLVVALFLIPALISKIKLPVIEENSSNNDTKEKFYKLYSLIINTEVKFKKPLIILAILAFGIPFFLLPKKLDNNETWYEKTYNKSLGNEWYLENVRPEIDKYLGGSLKLFKDYVFENATYNKNEETKLFVKASMEKGATVHQMNSVFLGLENYLSQFKEIKQYTTNVFSGDYAKLEITFHNNESESSFPFILKSRLISKAIDFGGIEWDIYGVGNGFNNDNTNDEPINFAVTGKGYNYDGLNKWADSLKVALESHPRIKEVFVQESNSRLKRPSYEYKFDLDKELIALSDFTPLEIVDELKQLTISKNKDISINMKGKYSPVRLESKQSKDFDIWHIKNTPIQSNNKALTLKNIAIIDKEREEENIYKENQEYVRLVEFQYVGAAKSGSKFLDQQLEELESKLPLGYTFEKSDVQWFFGLDNKYSYNHLLLLVLGIIYFVCAILFESFKQPFIILSVIPISFIGVFLTFYLFDFNFDQGGLSSFLLLSGITVNASIFIINGFNKLKKEYPNKSKIDLYLIAFQQKIFPILLTIISTILGFIPFIKDGQNEVFWFALGVGTIGGLIFSLVGILFYLPIFTISSKKKR